MGLSSKVLLFAICALISLQPLMIAYCVPYQENEDTLVQEFASQTPKDFGSESLENLFGSLKRDPKEDALIYEAYASINSKLVEQLPDSEDLDENLKVAEEWLNELSKSETGTQDHLNKALLRFCSLSQLKQPGKQCNSMAQLMIDLNNYYTSEQAAGKTEYGQVDRVKIMISDAIYRHKTTCNSVFVKKYKEILESKISPDTREEIHYGCLSDDSCETIADGMENAMNALRAGRSIAAELDLTDAIRDFSIQFNYALRSRVLGIQEWEFNSEFDTHILEPCSEYIDKFEKQVFLPASKYGTLCFEHYVSVQHLYDERRLRSTEWRYHLFYENMLRSYQLRYHLCQIALKYSKQMDLRIPRTKRNHEFWW